MVSAVIGPMVEQKLWERLNMDLWLKGKRSNRLLWQKALFFSHRLRTFSIIKLVYRVDEVKRLW